VEGLHVGGQHLAGLGDVYGRRLVLCAKVFTHVSAMGTVSNWGGGGEFGREDAARRGILARDREEGGVVPCT
jgi:hypothetical protein